MEVLRGEVVVMRRPGAESSHLESIRSDVYTNRILRCIESLVDELEHLSRYLVLSHAAHASLIKPVVCVSKEVISSFQGEGERMIRIEAIKKLWMAAHSSLSMPEGKTDLFKIYFKLFAVLCGRLLRMQGRGSEELVLPSVIDDFISRLYAKPRIQGPEGLECTQGVLYDTRVWSALPPRREIKNTASGDPTKPAKHSSNDATKKRKSEGDENCMCPICLDIIKDEKEEKGTITWPNCSHRFHLHCILKRKYKKPNCPLCRSGIFPKKKRQRQCRRRRS